MKGSLKIDHTCKMILSGPLCMHELTRPDTVDIPQPPSDIGINIGTKLEGYDYEPASGSDFFHP